MRYSKPALSLTDQVAQLKARGLNINDDDRAQRYLATIGYFRFSAYTRPFEQPSLPSQDRQHLFQPNTHFDQVLKLYLFDRKLRLLVMEGVERIEVAVRTTWAHGLAMHDGPHAHLAPHLFKSPWLYTKDIARTTAEIDKSSETFVAHYRNKYAEPFLPPVWAIVETMSLGTLSRWVANTKNNAVKKTIATTLGMPSVDILENLLHALTPMRNACAHHSRLWNRRFAMSLPHIKRYQADLIHPGSPNHQAHYLYNYLAVLAIMMKTMNPTGTWRARLSQLITQELAPHLLPAMGFPADWQNRPIWQGAAP